MPSRLFHTTSFRRGLDFDNTPYLANIGCQASMKEALELSQSIVTIPVKDQQKGWEPPPEETYPLIYEGVTRALQGAGRAKAVTFEPPYTFSMALCHGYCFDRDASISWKGRVTENLACWEAPSLVMGLELFNNVRELIRPSEEK